MNLGIFFLVMALSMTVVGIILMEFIDTKISEFNIGMWTGVIFFCAMMGIVLNNYSIETRNEKNQRVKDENKIFLESIEHQEVNN